MGRLAAQAASALFTAQASSRPAAKYGQSSPCLLGAFRHMQPGIRSTEGCGLLGVLRELCYAVLCGIIRYRAAAS